MQTRNQKLLAHINPATQIGVEIGPLMRPIITREMGAIRYVDHATTEELRAKYASSSLIDVNKIVNVDYVWGEKRLAELMQDELPFDYVLASHVIEHVPNFVGWLKEIYAVLKPGGILTLAIPDQRYCFDYYRFPTTAADVIDAYLRDARKPSPRNIFDHFVSVVSWRNTLVWATSPPEKELVPIHSENQAWENACNSFEKDVYIDVHCWVFTPPSFFNLLRALITLNLFDFTVKQFFETEGCEFFVSLEAVSPDLAASERQQLQLASLPMLASDQVCRPARYLEVYQQVEQLTAQLVATQNQLAATQNHLLAVQQEIQAFCQQSNLAQSRR